MAGIESVNLAEKLALFSERWAPKLIARLDDYELKLAKLEGQFVWHAHADADELFLVLAGELCIELRGDEPVRVGAGELVVVPKGVEHRPRADAECQVLLIEQRGVVNTGDAPPSELTHEPEAL